MSIDMEADGKVMDVPSPIRPKPRQLSPEDKVRGVQAALEVVFDEMTELRARIDAIESRLSDDGR